MNEDNRQENSQQGNSKNNHQQQVDSNPLEGSNASAAGPSSLSSDDEVPLGTSREERLVKKLKVIDVLSPKSSFDIADNEVVNIIQPAFNRMNVNQRNYNTTAMQNGAPTQDAQKMGQFKQQHFPSQKTISFGGAIPRSREPKPLPSRLTLLVSGTRFVVNPCIFTKHPNTLLGR